MKDYKHIEHMRNLNDSLIWERMKRCYDYGYEDGQKEKPQAIYEMKIEEYNKGLNEAWECARKMCLMSPEERLRAFDVSGNHLAILSDLTASQSIEKVKAYQKRKIYSNHTTEEIAESFIKDVSAVKDQLPEHNCEDCKRTKDPIFYGHCVGECDYAKQTEDEIKVGDEIRNRDAIEVVTGVMSTGLQTIDANGNASTWYYNTYPLETWKKTGRHFDEIKNVLDKMGEVDG